MRLGFEPVGDAWFVGVPLPVPELAGSMYTRPSCVKRCEVIACVRVLANVCQCELINACGVIDSVAAQRRDEIFVNKGGF